MEISASANVAVTTGTGDVASGSLSFSENTMTVD
jgi:hypothetical protein